VSEAEREISKRKVRQRLLDLEPKARAGRFYLRSDGTGTYEVRIQLDDRSEPAAFDEAILDDFARPNGGGVRHIVDRELNRVLGLLRTRQCGFRFASGTQVGELSGLRSWGGDDG
jgi:hypothetical protein